MIINETAKSLEEKVYLSLEDAILSGEYKRGEALTEMALSARLGASRTPVRAALHRLCDEGLVEIIPNRGAVVVGVTEDDLVAAYEIRKRLEGLASSMAASRISDGELSELTEVVELSEFYLNKGDTERLKECDTKFHWLIYKASGNRLLCKILSELHRNIRSYRKLSLSVPGRLNLSINEHKQILNAIAQRRAEDADRLTALHIERALENLKMAIKHD